MLGDGTCDAECNVEICSFDLNDCGRCAEKCDLDMLDNGVCNQECYTDGCLWDKNDCQCAEGCKVEDYGHCKDECMVPDCNYDHMVSQTCDHYTSTFWKYWQIYLGNFEAEWSLAASNCDVDTLKAGVDQVCSTNCQSKESLYQMGGCSSDCPDNCDICASSKCFKCSFGFLNYFGECLLDCPRCYHRHGLVTDICYSNYYLENDDTSSYANPTRFYVDFNKSRSNRDGSLQNPFKTLKEALDHNCDQFVEILLSPGIHIIDYSLSANEIPDLSLKLTPDCEVCAENTILQIQTPDFVFPTASLKEIYIENIIFDGEKALDPNCVSPNCPYCSYTAAEDSINYINPCASFENKNLFTISMSTNLCLRNTKFKNMRYDLQSIIYSSGGKIRLYNVDFYNIKIKDTAFDDPFYIITIKCDYSCTNILIYQTGSISLIGNGFEMWENIVQGGFLYAKSPGNISLSGLNFSYNKVLCGDTSVCQYLLYIYNPKEQVSIASSYFYLNYAWNSLIKVEMDDNFYINPLYVDGQYYQNFTNVMISNNEFIENASYKSLIEVNLSMYPTNVEVSTNKIIDFVSSSSVMIYVWTHYTNYYDESAAGGWLTLKFDYLIQSVYFKPSYIKIEANYIENCYANKIFSILNLPNPHYNNITAIWTEKSVKTIDEIVIDKFISIGYMNNRLLTDNIFTEIILFYIEVAYKVIASNNKVENNPISHFLAVEFDRISKSVYMDNNIFSKLEFENENKGLINIARDASNSNTPSTVEIRKMWLSDITNVQGMSGIVINDIQEITIYDVNIIHTSGKKNGGLYLTKFNRITMESVYFQNVTSTKIGSCVYLIVSDAPDSSINIKKSIFNQCLGVIGSGIYLDNKNWYPISVHIDQSEFINSKSDEGIIFIPSGYSLDSSSYVKNSVFKENSCSITGALTTLHTGRLEILNTTFEMNEAQIGASSIYGFFKSSDEVLVFNSVKFINNSGPITVEISSIVKNTQVTSNNCEFSDNLNTLIWTNNIIWSDTSSVFMFNDGAIFAQSFSQFTLINTNFTENSRNSVSTIDLFFSDLKCDGCTFEKNKFTPVSVSSQSTASFKNSHFYENHMQKRGSAIKLYRNAGTSYIENCYFYKNKALEGGLIIVTDSELVIENSVFEENESLSQDTPGIIITSSGVNITNSTFQNQTSQTSPIFISASSSDIKIDSCNFTEVIDLNYGFIYVASSFLQVKNSYFYHNGSASSEGTINSLNSDIYFDSCVFQDFLLSEDFQSKSIQASSGTLVMLNTKFEDFNENVMTLTSVKILSLTSCQFINGKYSEGVLVLNEVNDVMIFDCVFENISCVSHGSVINAKSSTTENSLYISNSLFANNTATLGGSFYAEGYNMTLKDSTLRNSQADYGGALYISNCECQIDNNVIINNSAHKSGGAIYFIGNEPILTNNMLDNNTALYGFNLASIPYQLSLVHESRELRIFDNVASSQTFQHVVKIALTDKFNDTVNYGYDDTEAIIVAESGVTLSGNIQIKPTYGVYSIENIKITAKPGSTTYIKLILGSLSVQNEIQLDIAMRECVPGEYQQKDACILCEDGKYSFDISHMCKNCPQNAKCYRGNIMAPYPGYWHGSNTSAIVYPCLNRYACLGGLEEDIGHISTIGKCAKGYKGNLCQNCEIGYSYSAQNECAICDNTSITLKISVIIIAVIIIVIIIVKSTIQSAYEPTSILSVYFKIFVNYLQLVSIVSQLRLSWPDEVDTFLDYQNQAGEVSRQFFSFDCLLVDNSNMDAYQDVYFKKLIIIAFLPILLLGGLTLGWVFIMLRHSKNDDYKPKFMGTLCVIFFLIHPSLTSYMFSIFSCMDLYGDEYLVKNLDIKCWDETHSFYAVAVALPAILIWSIGVPFFIFLYLVKNRHKLHQVDFKLKLGFLYTGYKTKVFYWEFVIMARKISIIILWVFLNSSSRSFQALACFTVLLVYLQMHYGKGPFERPDLNETEFRGLLVSTSTIYCGLYYLTDGLANGSKIFFFVLMIFSNLYFLLYWLIKVAVEVILFLSTVSVTIKEMFNVQENPIFVKRDGNKEILSLFKTHDFGGRMESRKNTKVWDFYWHSLEKIKNYSPKRQNIMDFTVEKFNVATSSNTDREERILFSGENTDREERILLIKDLDTHDI